MANVSIKPDNLHAPRAPAFSKEASTRIPYYVKGLALGVPIYFVAVHFWAWVLLAPHFYRRADFRQFYAAAYMARTGQLHGLYDYELQKSIETRTISTEPESFQLPFVSPAYHALLLSPLAHLSYRSAYLCFAAFNVVLLVICLVLLWPHTSYLRQVYPWLPIALFLGFYPSSWTLIEGQDSILLTALIVAAFALLRKGKGISAGALVGLALFKFQIVLPVVALFALWRRWRFLAGFAITAAVLGGISIWFAGSAQSKIYLLSILAIATLNPGSSPIAQHPVLWPMMPNVAGFLFGLFDGTVPRFWIEGCAVLVSLVLLAFTAIRGASIREETGLLLLALPCSVLVGYHTYMHDLSPLLLPVLVLLNSFLPFETSRNYATQKWAARSAFLMFVAPITYSYFAYHTYVVAIAVALLLFACATVLRSDTGIQTNACS